MNEELKARKDQLKKEVEEAQKIIYDYNKQINKLRYVIDRIKINYQYGLKRRTKLKEIRKRIAELKKAKSVFLKIRADKNKQLLSLQDRIQNKITYRDYFQQLIQQKDKFLNDPWMKHFNSFQGVKDKKQLESIIPLEKAEQNGLERFLPQSRFFYHPKNKALYMLQDDKLFAITQEGY